jgi:hypothetical protein
MGEICGCCKKYLQIDGFRLGLTSSQILVFSVDSRGFGREIDSLPNDEDAGAGSLVISSARRAATARAALHVPNKRVTTLAAGHSPWATRASASPPTPTRVAARPVVGRRQPPVARSPLGHPREHALAAPTALDRPGMAGLAVRVGVALAVARLRVRAAAAAHAHVAGLDRASLLARRVPSVHKALASIPAERTQHAEEAQRRRRGSRE